MGCCTSVAQNDIHQPWSQSQPPPLPKQQNQQAEKIESPPTNDDKQTLEKLGEKYIETPTKMHEQVQIQSDQNQFQIQYEQEQHSDTMIQEDKLKAESPIKQQLNPFQKLKQLGLRKQKQKQQREQKLAPLMDDLVNRLYEKSLNYQAIKDFCEENGVSFTDVLLYTDNMENSLIQIMANLDDYELFLQCFGQIEFQDGDLIYSIQKRIFQKLEKHQKGSPEQISYIINTLKQLGTLIENKQLLNYVQITYEVDVKSQIEYDEIQYVYSKFNQDQQIQNRYHGNYLNLFKNIKVDLQLQKECTQFDFGSYVNEFMALMQRAPLSAINQFIEYYRLPDQICHKSTNQRLNIIHCLCSNRFVNSNDYQLQNLLNSLSQCHKIDDLLIQPYHDQVPLVYYLDNQKEINQTMIKFLSKPFLQFTFNSQKINFQSQVLAQLFKVAKIKSFGKTQEWGPKLTKIEHTKQEPKKKCPKTNKNQHNQLNTDLQNYIEQLTDQFNQIYLYNVQVAKQLIKHQFKDLDFPWIKWDCPSSKLPTDFGGQQTGLISLLIRNGFTEKAQEEIQKIQEVEQDYELLELINKQLNQLEILEIIQYCQNTQLASKLLAYFKELKSNPCQKLIILLTNKIGEIIKQQPQILCNQIIGNSIFFNNQYETLYTSLYLIQDQNLLGSCLSVKPIISEDKRIVHLLLKNIIELKLADKINDPFEKALFNSIELVGKLYLSQYGFCFNFHQITEGTQIQDNTFIHIRTIFKINTKLVNYYILKYVLTGQLYTESLSFNIQQKVIQVMCEQYEGAQQLSQITNKSNISKSINKILWNQGIEVEQRLKGYEDNYNLNQVILLIPQVNQYQMMFKWLMAGYSFLYQTMNVEKQMNFTLEEEIINEMLKQNLSFVQILMQNDQYFKYFEKIVYNVIKDNQINLLLNGKILIQMFQNKAQYNISLFIDIFDMMLTKEEPSFQYPPIIENLSIHYFGKPQFSQKKLTKQPQNKNLDPKSIESFNENIQLLLQIIDQKSQHECQISYITNRNILMYIYPYITSQTLEKIGQQRLEILINNSNECPEIIVLCQNQDLQIRLLNAYINIYMDNEDKLQKLRSCFLNSMPLLKITYIAFLNTKYEALMSEVVRISKRLILSENGFFLEHLNKLQIDTNNLSFMFSLAFRSRNFKTLNALLLYSEQNKVRFNPSLISFGHDADSDDYNYIRATQNPYCVALNTDQYFSILNMNKQYTQEERNDHFIQILYAGQHQKLLLIVKQVNFDQILLRKMSCIIWIFLNQFSLRMNNWEKETNVQRKIPQSERHDEDGFQFERLPGFLNIPPNNRFRKQNKQLSQIPSLFQYQDKLELFLNENQTLEIQKATKLFEQEKLNQFYQERRVASQQNHNYSTLFQSSGGQNINQLKCFEILQKYIVFNKITEQDTREMLEIQFALMFPQKQTIQETKILYNSVINLIHIRNLNINQYPFLKSNLPKYIELIQENLQEQELTEYLVSDYQYLKRVIREQITDKNILANIMIEYNLTNEKSIAFIRKYLSNYTGILNNRTLFYLKKEIKLIQMPTNITLQKKFNRKFKQLEAYMDISTFNQQAVTPTQMYLIKGRPDHIAGKYQFQQADLIAACLSNTWQSLEFILKSHPNPSQLGFEQNLFQTLIIYSNEAYILNYFNEFVKPYSKDINRLMYRDETPMLYYVVHKKMAEFFKQFYIEYLTQLMGAENQRNILVQQLNSQPSELFQTHEQMKLGQYALLCNFYEIFEYIQLTPEDSQYIKTSRFLFSTDEQILDKLNFGQKYSVFCKLFVLLRPQVVNCTYNEPITIQQVKLKKQLKHKLKKKNLQNSINERFLVIQEIIKLERSIIYLLYEVNSNDVFLREHLNILLFNEQKRQEILLKHKYTPDLVMIYLQLQGIQVPGLDKNTVEAISLIKSLGKVEQLNKKQILQDICLHCNQYYGSTHPVYKITMQQFPDIFLLNEFLDIILGNLELAILLIRSQVDNNQLNQMINNCQASNFTKKNKQLVCYQTVVYTLVLLNCINKDEFQEDFLLKNSIPQCQLSQILKILSNYQNIQNKESVTSAFQELAFKFIEQIEFEDKYLVVNSVVSLYNEKLAKSIELLLHLQAIQDIVENFTQLLQKISLNMVNTFKYKVTLQNKPISYDGQVFEIPLKFDEQLGQFLLENQKIDDFVPQFKSQLFDMFIKEELQKKYQDIQNKYIEFNLDSILLINPHDVQITNAEQMIQQLFFFKNLLEPQPEVGVYHVDDVFAPHQHEQVRPPELTLGQQQSQVMQSSNMNNPQLGRQISNQQYMKEDFQFMFELLPDNTYQVRQRKRQDQEELIFAEFYHFKLPKTIINVMKLDQDEYFRQYNGSNTISIIIQDFYKYSQYLTNVLSDQQQDEWIVNLPYTMNDYKFIFQEQLLSVYNIPKILNKMDYFINNVKQLVGRGEDTSIVQWRIQIVSFLEVLVSKLVEIQNGDTQVLNIYTIIDQIFEWDTLIMVLHQILYNNLVKAQQVLKVIRGIYFEFNEIQNVFAPDEFAQGLDAIFAFGHTTYLLYNHMLIVRLNVGLRQQSTPAQIDKQIAKQRSHLSVFKQDNAIQQYIHSIINEYDFYTQIFTPEQLVQFLFNKLTVDREMLSISNQISKLINKTITLSVDHQGLARIFSPEIQNIKQVKTQERLKTCEEIWYILQRLSRYFKEDIFQYLKKQLTTDRFDEMFHIRLFTILEALKSGKPVSSITNSNQRDISVKEKTVVLQKLCPLLPKSQIILSFQFGFQVLKNYYTNNSKLGEVCTICFCIDSKTNNVNTVQLVYNSKGGEFLFIKLDQKSDLLTKEQIIRQQNYYSNQKASSHEFLLVSIEDIHSVIVYQPSWPSDQIFNQSIVNVFFTDAQGYLSISNEPKFLKKMVEIQLEQNEETKQELLDRLFGVGVVNVFSDLTLTSLTPIFPDQINFEFTAHNLLKKQQSMISGHIVQITIAGDKFIIAPIELAPISIACYFETSKKFQQVIKQFQKFLNSNPELPNISLIFDDNMNADPQYYLDSLAHQINVIESFQNAYSEFKQDKSGPQFTNSLQFMLGWNSLKFRKEQIIMQFIKKVELHFVTYDQTDLVVFENNTLKFYCTEYAQPEEYQILNFFNNKFLKFQENELKQYILPNNFEIQITKRYDNEQMKIIVELICLIDGFATLMKLKPIVTKIEIISMFELPNDAQELKNEFYFFKSDVLYLIYNNYRDFSMATFLVDYLNQSTIRKTKLDHYQYTGPLIIKDACQIQLQDVFQGLVSDQVEVTILKTDSDPQEFNQFMHLEYVPKQYLALKVDGKYCQIQIVLSDQINEDLKQFMKQTTCQQIICSNIYLLIENLNVLIHAERQLQKVEFRFDQKSASLAQFCTTNKDLKAKTQFISDNCLLVELYSDKSKQYKITSPFPIQMIHGEKSQDLTIAYISQYSQDLSQTQHVSLILDEGKEIPVSNENNVLQTGNGYGDPKLMKILLKSAKKVDQETLIHKNYEGSEYIEDLQKGNTINMLSKQEIKSASRSGQGREDYIEFKDSLGNTVQNFTYETLIFVHTLYPQIQYKPNARRIKNGLSLQWQPVFKGIYKLFINDVRVQGKFVILAFVPSPSTSLVEIEQVNVVPFYEPIPISFLLKDKYQNICGDIEQQTFNDCICEIQLKEGSTSKLQSSQKLITKFGQLNFTIHFEPQEVQAEDEITELIFIVQKNQFKSIPIKISGISLEKRRNKFQTELNNSFKSCSYNLSIRRMSFLQDLLLLAEKKMNYSFNIKFVNEPGIDAGGLKREFYDMIGTTLKDDQYKFFTAVPNNLQKHFLSNHFNKLKDKQVYALLFGKLIANAIANTYIIGIDIVYPFWKVVYGEQVNFQDLKVIVDETTFRNLESIKLQPEQIDALCLDFTYNQVDLINNGSNISVTAENVDQYLDKVADYLIYQRYKTIYKSFIQGFDSVIDIKLFQKWLRPSEISLLTQGLSEIKADIILSKSTYSGGNNQHKSFWETYIMQAEPQMLRNMLKFITGSSAIPFDQSSYILQIQFMKNLDTRKLPLAHTCFKSIEVPHYTTYSQLKQKLDIAFTIGLEGYGFG